MTDDSFKLWNAKKAAAIPPAESPLDKMTPAELGEWRCVLSRDFAMMMFPRPLGAQDDARV
jgi:hypothetical protein